MKKVLIPLRCEYRSDFKRDYGFVCLDYIRAIEKANAIPFIYHSTKVDENIALDFDGLLIPGGEDIEPRFYNDINNGKSKTINPKFKVDELDIDLIKAFSKANKPILGICRGLQIINVAFGGTLYQDINTDFDILKDYHDQSKRDIKGPYGHEIDIVANTTLASLMNTEVRVNSLHHQAIKDVAPGFIVSAYSKDDHIIEAIEKDNIIAVQWHPERLIDNPSHFKIFEYFIDLMK